MARRSKKGRPINGVVLVDKHRGESSNRVLQQVKRIFNAQKAGHTGALDPLATGMLPVCLGEATKFSQFLLDADKVYQVRAQLGVRTDTSDADGEVVETRPVAVSDEQLATALEQFRGDIEQVPSMFSALKHQGKPLYEYARKGIEIERPARPITIYRLDLLSFNADYVELEVHCSKGTYIRSLIDDLGQVLGCGAHVQALHRTQVADYPAQRMLSVDALQQQVEGRDESNKDAFDYTGLDGLLLPLDSPVSRLGLIRVSATQGNSFRHGQPVNAESAAVGTQVRVEDTEGTFLGVAEYRDDGLAWPKRLVVFDLDVKP
ncbi:tRNA pseudouridine(55) synthase TruB [Aliidiomarina sp. Khilg15.8]